MLQLDVDRSVLPLLSQLDFVELEGSYDCGLAGFLLHHQNNLFILFTNKS